MPCSVLSSFCEAIRGNPLCCCRDEGSLDQAITMNGTHLRGRPLRVSYGQAKKPKVSAFQAAALQLAEGLGD